VVRGTFSPARAWRLAVDPASTRTLGLTETLPRMSSHLDTPYAALLFDELEDYEELIAALTEHVDSGKPAGAALHNRAIANWEIGRNDEALADFDAAAAALPGDYMPPKMKGSMLKQLGRLEEALASLDRAVEIAPAEATVLRTRAQIREEAGAIEGALDDLERAIAAEPSFDFTRKERERLSKKLKSG